MATAIEQNITAFYKLPTNANIEAIGEVCADSFSSDDWDEAGTSTTWTYNANSIDTVSTAGNFTPIIRYNKWFSMSEDFTMTAVWTANTVDANNVMLGTGIAPVSEISSGGNACWVAVWTNVANNGLIYLYNGNGNVVDTGQLPETVVAGDQILVTLTYTKNVLTATARNLTNLSAIQTLTYTTAAPFTYGQSVLTQSAGQFQPAFLNYKGNFTINSWSYTLNNYKNIYLLAVGDSKTKGFYGNTFTGRFIGQVETLRNNIPLTTQVAACGGNITQDILNCMPEILLYNPTKVYLFIGRNDISGGISTGVWQANLLSIYTQLVNAGFDVYVQNAIQEAAGDGTAFDALNTYIGTIVPANKIIAQPATWDRVADNTADQVHPNDTTGQTKIFDTIKNYI